MADVDTVSRYTARVEIALTNRHYDLAHRIITELEASETSPPDAVALDSPLSATDLPLRLIGILDRHGVRSIGDALRLTRGQLRELRGVGPGGVQTIVDAMRALQVIAGDD